MSAPVTTASSVPVTREEELEGDEALETLGRTGRMRLALDAVVRFRAADGFSHSRALAFQITLAILPGIIAVGGLAATLDVDAFTRVVRGAIRELAPGRGGQPRPPPPLPPAGAARRSASSRRAPSATSSPTHCGRARPPRVRTPA